MANDSTKRRYGYMPCEGMNCRSHDINRPVAVFINAKETLSYRCDCCGRARYALKGNEDWEDWMKEIKQDEKPAAKKPAPSSPADPDQDKPAEKKRKVGFFG